MFILTAGANITPEKVYQMDDHMFNWIGVAITIVSLFVAIATIYDSIREKKSFDNFDKKINNQKDKIDDSIEEQKKFIEESTEKLQALAKLKKEISSDLIEIKRVNAHMIANHIMSYTSNLEDVSAPVLINALIELHSSIPDSKTSKYIFYLRYCTISFEEISSCTKKFSNEDNKKICGLFKKIYDKTSLKLNGKKLSDEDVKEIEKYRSNMKKYIDEIEDLIKPKN